MLPRRGDDYDEGAGEDEDRDGVHEGDCRLGTMGEAVHWKSQAERYFSECTQLRAMVMALRETFDEVEEENEEMHWCARTAPHQLGTLRCVSVNDDGGLLQRPLDGTSRDPQPQLPPRQPPQLYHAPAHIPQLTLH